MLKCHHVESQRIQDFLEAFLMLPIKNEVFSGEQEKEFIIRVRMGSSGSPFDITRQAL